MLSGDLGCIEGALRFVEDQHVFRWYEIGPLGVRRDVVLDSAHKGLTASARVAKLVLQHLHERAIARQVDRWCCWLAIGAGNRQIVEETGVGKLQAHEGLPGTWQAGEQHESSRSSSCRHASNLRNEVERWPRLLVDGADPADLTAFEQLTGRLNQGRKRPIGGRFQELVDVDGRAGVHVSYGGGYFIKNVRSPTI